MPPTYKDIQRLTGLSLSTISKYFNNKSITPKNKEAIQQAVEQLDYRVNIFAQSLKSQRSRAVGIMLPDLSSIFNATIVSEAGHYLRKRGYSIMVSDSHSEREIETESIQFLLSRQVDGIIANPISIEPDFLRYAIQEDIPVVVFDQLIKDYPVDSVVLDNRKAAAIAVEELVKNGHTQIGVVTGQQWMYSMNERKWGVWRALQNYGITPNSHYFIYSGFTVEEGYHSTKQLLSMPNPPTALIATNDLLTLGMITAVQEMQLQVPDDISLIGFDCTLFEGVLGKPLTMIVQPYQQLAEDAAHLLLKRMNKVDSPKKRQVIMEEPLLKRGATIKNLHQLPIPY